MAGLPLSAVVRQAWFRWPLAVRLVVWLVLAHSYEIAVFQDASRQLVAGQGIYARFATWLASSGDGYYAAPPLYGYLLWVSGRAAASLGNHWWFHQLLIKSWLLLADLAVMGHLLRRAPTAARAYWTLWFVPVVAIGQVQPDLWVGLCVLAALHLAAQDRWAAAGFLLGVGAGFKPVPFLILPFLAAYLLRTGKGRALAPAGLGVLLAVILTWLPYALAFPDIRQVTEVLRFHAGRPIAGLTIPSGALLLTNAGLALVQLFGGHRPWLEAAYTAAVRAGVFYPIVTAAAFVALLARAGAGRRWSLEQTFCLPLLMFLATNKVVHEHYVLQVLPLLLVLGARVRGLAVAFSVYLLAAGSPLRFFPGELGLPSTVDAVLPPLAGIMTTVGLVAAAGVAALAFGWQVLVLTFSCQRREGPCAVGPD